MSSGTKWDAPTRILHWIIAGCMILLLLSAFGMEALEETVGKTAEMQLKYLHLYVGIVLTVAVTARVIWGFFGNDSVNWRGIPSGLAQYPGWVRAELDFTFRGVDSENRKKGGHNPLAIPVYVFALVMIVMQSATGLSMWGHLDKEAQKRGLATPAVTERIQTAQPSWSFGDVIATKAWADDDDDERHGGERHKHGEGEESFFEELHESGMLWVPLFLLLHLGGMFIHKMRGEGGLLKGMLWG